MYIENSVFQGNSAGDGGGGIYADVADAYEYQAVFVNTVFNGNFVSGGDGGAVLINCC